MKSREDFQYRAERADKEDKLKHFRSSFMTNDRLIYFDGNSLGMMPLRSEQVVNDLISHEWGQRLIRSWNENWWEMPMRVSKKISELIGSRSEEVVVCDSTSVNLYKLVSAALKIQKGREKIISDDLNFPSDLYVIQGIINNLDKGHILDLVESENGIDIEYDKLFQRIDKNTAVVVLSYVSFRSAFMYDMEKVTKYAHSKGALVIWDLSHAAGAVEIDLESSDADMAVGCTYKYLNGGPGSPAFLYVHRKMQDSVISPVWAWLGEKNPFEFSLDYRASAGARKYMTGSPSILSLCTLEPSLDILAEAGMDNIRTKSVNLASFLLELYHAFLQPHGFLLGSPEKASERGSHISLKHKEGYRICKALIDDRLGNYVIIPDFRPPDNIRLGLAPLYNRFDEVYRAVLEIEKIVKEKLYESYDSQMDNVT